MRRIIWTSGRIVDTGKRSRQNQGGYYGIASSAAPSINAVTIATIPAHHQHNCHRSIHHQSIHHSHHHHHHDGTQDGHSSSSSSSLLSAAVPLHSLDFPYLKSGSSHDSYGRTLNYAHGSGSHDAPILIMHGLLGNAGNWRTTAPKLTHTRRIISVDLRNHGSSPHVDDMSLTSCAADVIQLMNEKHIDQAILLGHSLGGKVSMATSLLYPERIAGIIVVDMSPATYQWHDGAWSGVANIVKACAALNMTELHDRSEVDQLLKAAIPNFMTRAFVLQNVVVTTTHTDPSDPTSPTKRTVSWRCNMPALFQSLASVARFDIGLDKPFDASTSSTSSVSPHAYTGPTLFIGGGDSAYLTTKQLPAVRYYFPSAQCHTIAEAGHWVHVDKPQEFIEKVKTFLDTLENKPPAHRAYAETTSSSDSTTSSSSSDATTSAASLSSSSSSSTSPPSSSSSSTMPGSASVRRSRG